MGSKFGQIRPWTVELPALERLEKSPYIHNGRSIVTTLVLSILNLADKKDNYNNLNEYEFRQGPMTYYEVSCPWAS